MQIRPFSTTFLRLSAAKQPPSIFAVRLYSNSSAGQSSQLRRHHQEEDSRNVKVSVWWDFENCNLPAGANVFKVAQAITSAIRTSGIKGPITITAFGDVLQLSRTNQEALSSTGINLSHIPNGGKNSADRSLLVDLMFWVSQNPPPAHLFLISGDRDFASILHRLRMNNYNILLASKDSTPGVLCSSASIMWNWFRLAKGEGLTGMHFNQPPDGPYGSWYGHYRGPLADPFATSEKTTTVKTDEMPVNCSDSDSKSRPVPASVVNQIEVILSSNPKGISLGDLRAELKNNGVVIDKNFYGHKNFSRFLVSMSDLLKVQFGADGKGMVYGIRPKSAVPYDSSISLSVGSDQISQDKGMEALRKVNQNDDVKLTDGYLEGRTEEARRNVVETIPEPENWKVDAEEEKTLEKIVQETIPASEPVVKETKEPVRMDQLTPVAEPDSSEEDGLFKKLKRLLFGPSELESTLLSDSSSVSDDGAESQTPNVTKLGNDSNRVSKKKKVDEKHTEFSSSSSVDLSKEVTMSDEVNVSAEEGENKSKTTGVLDRVVKWLKFWKNEAPTVDKTDEATRTHEPVDAIFTQDSFWADVESFVFSIKGSFLISQSRTREELARNLQKDGPSCLEPLRESTILSLVDLLISDKKWVKNCPSENSPFRVAWVGGKNFGSGHSQVANGLRSIFLEPKSKSNGSEAEKQPQNVSAQKISGRSRSEVLADCQKLVKEALKEHPEGYIIGCFRKDFLEKFGYRLDNQKLGFEKLQSLIQVIPGVRVESGYIFPSRTALNDSDSPFEELGPVSEKNTGKQCKQVYDYEPSVSEDEEPDTEAEASSNHSKKKSASADEEDSSLLQILDSWYGSKEGDDQEKKPDVLISSSSVDVVGSKDSKTSHGKKTKPAKIYSFVSDSVDNKKDKLVDAMLGSLKKSSESRMNG